MDIPFWAFCALLVALVYVSLLYFAARMGAEGLIAYMLWHNYLMPTRRSRMKNLNSFMNASKILQPIR